MMQQTVVSSQLPQPNQLWLGKEAERKGQREGAPWICVNAGEPEGAICGGREFKTVVPGEVWQCVKCGGRTFIPRHTGNAEPVNVPLVKRIAGRVGEKKARRSAHSKGYVKRGVTSWWRDKGGNKE